MEIDEKKDFLFKILNRFDGYISATNTKAAIILTFQTFITGSVILSWNKINPLIVKSEQIPEYLIMALVIIITISTMFSLWYSFKAIAPFLKSPKSPNNYHSNIFFEHVSEYETENLYFEEVNNLSTDKVVKDLAYQVHAISRGLSSKFKALKYAVRIILFVEVPCLLVIFYSIL